MVIARVHPGECGGSYMVEGLIKELCGDSEAARRLRDKFVIEILPMVNPDGVVVGNSR